jgi:hypothetical protein
MMQATHTSRENAAALRGKILTIHSASTNIDSYALAE